MEKLESLLANTFSHVADRQRAANHIDENPELFEELFALACAIQSKKSHIMAAWVLEKYSLNRLEILLPLIDSFIHGVAIQIHESKRRPMMKLLYHFCKNKRFRERLSGQQKDAIAAACFDYLLEAKKVAAIAFAMKTLHFFRSHKAWINEELNAYIAQKLPNSSSGFQSVVRQIS